MAKATKTTKTTAPNVGRVASAAVEAYSGIANSGVHFVALANVAREEFGDTMMTKEQADSVIESVTAARGWADDERNPKPRQSELRNILRTFREGRNAAIKWADLTGRTEIGYDDYVKLARGLSKARGAPKAWGDKAPPALTGEQVTAAVTSVIESQQPKAKPNPTKDAERKEAVKLLNKCKDFRKNWMPDGFHADVDKLLAKFG